MRHSAKIDKIASALLAVQSRVQPVKRDALNQDTESRYSTVVALMDALRAPMVDAGLSYTQSASSSQIGPAYFATATTLLMHGASGQWIEADLMLPIGVVTTQQGAAAVTFAKRVGLASITGTISEVEDRDSEGQEPEPVIEKRLTMIHKIGQARGILEHFRQSFTADDQKFVCRDAALARRVAEASTDGVNMLPVTLTLKGYADGEVEIVGIEEAES